MPATHTIFYAEDDLDDLFIVKQAFQTYDGAIKIIHANNGLEALEMLQAIEDNDALPCLILLDINMPGMDGRETLIKIKQDERLKHIPVVMFSTSSSSLDKEFATRWNVRFFTKPLVYSDMEKMVDTFVSLCEHSTTAVKHVQNQAPNRER
jgi:CheY-like chemotaxis protein